MKVDEVNQTIGAFMRELCPYFEAMLKLSKITKLATFCT